MALVGLLIGIGVLVKSQAVLLLPAAWLAALIAWRGARLPAGRALLCALAATAVTCLVGGWWLVRNQLLYGDPLAVGVFLKAFVATRPTPQVMMESFDLTPLSYVIFWVVWWTFRSFWGQFGPSPDEVIVFYPNWTYAVLGVLTLAAAVGLLRAWIGRRHLEQWQRRALFVPVAFALLVTASFVRFNMTFFQGQGRYLFPALQFWAVFFVLGIASLAPPRARPAAALAVALLVLALALGGFPLIHDLRPL
jgi:hypothetical protein